ncbi:spermidine Putrescine ABC transporter permease component PotB [Halarchaeum acidiphilum MH1-52-1]|uniref:Spermidine Putrescine ABC transporter permease component PotB n=1 Tax=Halarchaeum acidiphilum MH1-52-1 TaxID=1261545 RepID=U2YS77_9EURY|nr:ABC transporter permease [Halarchaeum acidiphilum]GAD51835.1 spermidine Putrescine ABC transporter permease component PotB [Halarchaeum acidiphilum MH1-52-1]
MAAESASAAEGRAGIRSRTKYLVAAYPSVLLGLLFVIPLLMLVVFSFYLNVNGGYFKPGFTFENYVRFFTHRLYRGQLLFTLQISFVTTLITLVLGYPLAYYLSRMNNGLVRRAVMILVVSTLWITYVIRAYVWTVLLAKSGPISKIGVALGILPEPTGWTPGYWALVIGMAYAFLPFMILSLYNSLKNIDGELIEASKNLGAGPLETFRRVTLPLSKNGVISGSALVFILSLGVYVLPKILGSPSQWTIAIIIGDQVNQQQNIPFAAAMSIALMVVVVVILGAVARFTDVSAIGMGGDVQ